MRSAFSLAAIVLSFGLSFAAAAPTSDSYVFTYFTKNGEDGLHLAWSRDGYTWEALNGGKSYLAPKVGQSKLMRDPCVLRGPDGTFHLVWTSGWNENNIGYASSKDLIHWSAEKEIPVMAHEPTVRNCWAPEVAYDDQRGEFIIFWASTIPEKSPKPDVAAKAKGAVEGYRHKLYFTTTKDFVSFAPTKLFYDPGFSVIDATFLKANGHDYLIVKDETGKDDATHTEARKYLQMTQSDDMQGPFAPLSAPFTPKGLWSEGPTAIRIGDDYLVYFDAYTQKHYGALRSRDLKTWEDVTAKMSFPNEGTELRMRHGTVIAIPADLAANLRRTAMP